MGVGCAVAAAGELGGFVVMMVWGRYVPPLHERLIGVRAWVRWTACSTVWWLFAARAVYAFFREDSEMD
jgi:nitrate/nitrite transporter NarK